MESRSTKRSTFLQGWEDRSPVKLSKVSVSRNLTFFNANSGSKMEETDELDFVFSESSTTVTKVKNIAQDTTGSFTTVGFINWSSEAKTVEISSSKIKKQVRDDVFADGSDFNKISVWGDLILAS